MLPDRVLTVLLVAVVMAVAVGGAPASRAGALIRRRFAVVLVPVAFVIVLELAQLGLVGPTVDRPHLTVFGLLAWAAVRLVPGLLLVAPMAAGHRGSFEQPALYAELLTKIPDETA